MDSRRLRFVIGVDSSMRVSSSSGTEVKANKAIRNAREAIIGIVCHDAVGDQLGGPERLDEYSM